MRSLCILLIFSTSLFSFSQSDSSGDKLVYKRIGINVSDNTIETLEHIGLDIECGTILRRDSLFLELDHLSIEELTAHSIDYEVLIDDMEAYYSSRAKDDLPRARFELQNMKLNSDRGEGNTLKNLGQHNECGEIDWPVPMNFHLNPNTNPNSFGGCLTYDQVLQELDDMRALYPHLISLKLDASPTNQTTIEGRTIHYVRISDNPDIDEPDEPETLYQSLIHSREAGSLMQLLYFMWYVLENYDSDSDIQSLVNNQALYFIPVFNPDGFVYNETQSPNGGGMQRKNRNVGGGCTTFLDGIDLNRNSAYYWGNGGSSATVCNQTYMGTAPFSENETQIMRDFFLLHDFKLALNHHSYKNAMLHGYAGTNITNPRPDEYAKYSHDMSYYNRYAYGPSTSISSLNSGNMNDWMLGGPSGISANGTPTGTGSGKNTLAWTPENGNFDEGGFWPLPSNFVKIAKRSMRMNFLAAYYSGKYAKLHDLNTLEVDALSGAWDFGVENLGQTASDFTVSVLPVSANILSVSGAVITSGLQNLEQITISFNYTLNSSTQAEDTIAFKVSVTNNYNSDSLLFETNMIKIYQPQSIFKDDPDIDGIDNWTPYSGLWGLTTNGYSSTTAITSTLSAPYSNQESKSLELNSHFDLSNFDETTIQYFAKWDLERSFDYVQFEASIDGINWFPLCGELTKPGASDNNNTYSGKGNQNSFQPDDEPLYDGDTRGEWRLEEIKINADLNSFLMNQTNVSFRFNFMSDATNSQDAYYNANFEGFAFDDFTLINGDEIISNVGVNEFYSETFKVFPNPINDKLIIDQIQDVEINNLSIYQSSGKLVYQVLNCYQHQIIIDSQDWQTGLYFVVVNKSQVYKIAKLQ